MITMTMVGVDVLSRVREIYDLTFVVFENYELKYETYDVMRDSLF